jgi:Domain of unknown function (DUF4263)/Leucine rich repeat variant
MLLTQMDNFEEILLSPKEEICQSFLALNTEILTFTFKRDLCLPKFRFGNEFVSDFVLFTGSSLGYEITLVEIEPPTAKAFTKKGKYARRLNDAIGQINDWFVWISQNEDYFLRTLFAAISASQKDSLFARWFDSNVSLGLHRGRAIVDAKVIIGRRHFLSEQDNMRRAAIYHSSNRTIEITHFDRLLNAEQELTQIRKAYDRTTGVEELTELSGSEFPEVRGLIASNAHTSESTLQHLADDPDAAVVSAVIRNKNTPYAILRKFAQRKDRNLNLKLIQRAELPTDLFAILFETDSNHLRRLILEHPSCSKEVLICASKSDDRGERRRAAQHPNLRDAAVLSRLADDPEPFVRTGAALNPHLPPAMIAKLSDDEDKKVRWAARYQNINASESTLIRGIETEDDWARSLIAKHPNLKDVNRLAELARDKSWWVREALAKNKNLPTNIREVLITDTDERVRRAAEIPRGRQ